MNLTYHRYNTIRERLLALFNVLNHRVYPVWIAPKTLMTTDELRGRYESKQEGFANDTRYYEEHQLRQIKIPQLLDIMENITGPQDIGFNNANKTVVEIYESIQEYIGLWCEVLRHAPEFGAPPRTELRALESLAYIIFPIYKSLKVFSVNQANREQFKYDQALNNQGLAGLGALFSMNRIGTKSNEEISFSSHLDALEEINNMPMLGDDAISHNALFFPPAELTKLASDSISSMEDTSPMPNDWIFRG